MKSQEEAKRESPEKAMFKIHDWGTPSVDQSNRGAVCFFVPTPTKPKSLIQPTHDAQTSESPQEELTEPVPNKRMKNTSSTQLTESVALLGNPDNESSTIPLSANNYDDWIKVPSRRKFLMMR